MQMDKKKMAKQVRNSLNKKQAKTAKIQDSNSAGNDIHESDDHNDASSNLSPTNMSEFVDKADTFVILKNIAHQSDSQPEVDNS